ncbi:putative Ran binding domain, PH-like domain superfamily [Helianthus annuus]|nr:putative Ran binding domain, PH-like domain superfamily [Helianthus annuus]
MHQSKTLKICANHLVIPTMSVQEHAGNDKSCVLVCGMLLILQLVNLRMNCFVSDLFQLRVSLLLINCILLVLYSVLSF